MKIKGLRQSIDNIKKELNIQKPIKQNKFMRRGCFNEYTPK